MFNTYTNSVLWPIRSKGYQDYCSLLPGRSDSYQFSQASTSSRSRCCCASSCVSCCCCSTSSSSYVKPKVWIHPGFVLYGLRQSTLIQWPSFRRRLVVGGGGQGFDRLLRCEDSRHCCEAYSSCSCRNVDTRRNRSIGLRAAEDSHACFSRSCPDDVEAMISFLSEELIDEFSCDKERNWNSISKVAERKKGRPDSQFHGGNVRKVEVEARVTYGNGRSTRKNQREELEKPERFGRQENKRNGTTEDVQAQEKYGCEHCCGGRKKTSQLKSDSHGYKSVSRDSNGKKFRQKDERDVQPRRSKSSSCSNYSLASSEDFESDTEEQDEDLEFHRENQRISEKKLIGDSNKRLKSRKGTSQMHSRRKMNGSASGVASSYHQQVFVEDENSNQAVTLNKKREKQFRQIGSRVSESRGNHEEDMEIQEIHVNDVEMNSQNQKLISEREDNRVHSVSESSQQQLTERFGIRYNSEERTSDKRNQYKYTCSQEERANVFRNYSQGIKDPKPLVEEMISNQAGTRLSTERFSEKSETHDMNIRNTYVTQSEVDIRNQEVRTDMVPGLQSQVEQQSYHIDQTPLQQSSKTGRRLSTERFSEKSETHEMDIRNTYVTQSEDYIRNQELRVGLVPTPQSQVEQQGYHIDQIPLQKMEADKTFVSASHTSDTVWLTEIKRKSEERIIGQEIKRKAEESVLPKDSRIDHAKSKKEGQKATLGLQSSHGMLSQEASGSQSFSSLISQNRMQLVNLVSEEMQGSETRLIPPSSQLVSRGSGYNYETAGATIQEIYDGTSESDYRTAFENPGAGTFISSQDAGELTRFATDEDALGSARRFEQSSEKLITEFVEKAKHEASTSETEDRRAESNQLKRRDSKRSSDGSGAKGPSDEMWVTNSTQGTPQLEAKQDSAAEESAIVKRSGRSMWSVIADIARLRWGPRAGSPESSAKPTRKSSPNESVSSATWFSGREHEGSSDDNTKADGHLPLEGASPHGLEVSQTFARTQSEYSGTTKSNQQSPTIVEGGSAPNIVVSTSSDQIVGVDDEGGNFQSPLPEPEVSIQRPTRNLKRSPAINESSESSPTGVSNDQNVSVGDGRRYEARVPEMVVGQKPLLLPRQSLKSPVAKEHSESVPTLVSGSSSLRDQVEQQPLSAKSPEETGSASRDSALIQRKFQRNKQVVRDRFEEWEDAYRVEAERRLVDETFMREALAEAKKAGDIWEVPVGAVLVHDGKIIARGFNLVEELRDSTAHAEIICIREGSKVLRSWRLADTTLYVTLEPCPMCAGAILQARVNTLVWGAPNKLLGADGSWIRLFPRGEGNGSEQSDKPPPPIHPFHPKMTIRRGVLESECAQTMQQFFQLRRKKKDKTPDNKNTDPRAHHHHHHHLHPSKLLNKMHQVLPFFCL